MSNAFFGINKGQDYLGPLQAVQYATSTNGTDIELRVTTTNAGAATGLNVKDVILGLRKIEQYLNETGVNTLAGPSVVDIVYPGQG